MPKPVLHGRDHRPGGADPIEGLGGGGGIQFDIQNEGGWLWVEGHDIPNPSGVWGSISFWDDSGYGISFNSYGGAVATPTGQATFEVIADDGMYISSDHNSSHPGPNNGDIDILSSGVSADITLFSDRDINLNANDGGIWIDAGSTSDGVYIDGVEVDISSWGGTLYLSANGSSTDVSIYATRWVNLYGTSSVGISSPGSIGMQAPTINLDGTDIGFFGATPTGQPAIPATLGDVISALQDLGLVAS